MAFRSTPGNWNILGYNLPDIGLSESFGGSAESLGSPYASSDPWTPYTPPHSSSGEIKGLNYTPINYTPIDNSPAPYNPPTYSNETPTTAPVENAPGQMPGENYNDFIQRIRDDATRAEEERQQQLQDEVDRLYGGASSALEAQRQSLLGNKTDFLSNYSLPFESQVPLVQQAGQEGLSRITGQKKKVKEGSRNALDEASRLFNELGMRNRQLFGGGGLSSAGQAAGEILSREQMRNVGSIRQNTTNALAELETQYRNLQGKVDSEVNNLELQKQNALSQARIAFDDKLRAIEAAKGQLEENKSVAKIQALRDFNNTIRGIEDQVRTLQFNAVQAGQAYAQQVASQYQALQSSANDIGSFASSIPGAANAASAGVSERYSTATPGVGANLQSGILSGKIRSREDKQGLPISGLLPQDNKRRFGFGLNL